MLRHNRILWIICLLVVPVVCACIAPRNVSAQGAPGTIRGVIRDGETNELLDYANVLLDGTQRGTMSLGGGVFYFQGLPAGTYTVKVLYLGYAPEIQTITVQPGETASVQFEMKVVIVETLEAFDVEGAKYMVEVKSASSEQKIQAERFQRYAIDSVEDALSKQAGVVMRAGELYVRGGRSGEVSMRIDDVPVDNPLGGAGLSVSTLAVEAINTVTGGLDAEYGNALSGVVNITTKTGGEKFEGGVRYLTDDFGRQDKTFTNFDRFEYGFGGPTPVDRLTYYISGDLNFTDTETPSVAHRPEYKVKIGDTTLFKVRPRQVNNAKGSVKLAYSFGQGNNKKLTGEYTYSNRVAEFYSPNWSVSGYAQQLLYLPEVRAIQSQTDPDAWIYTGRVVPVYFGPWVENMRENSRTVIVLDTRNSSFVRRAMPILEVRSAADNRVYMVVPQPLYDGYRYPFSSFSTVQEDSSYTWFNSANNDQTRKDISQQFKVVWRQNLTNDTFYTLKLAALTFDNRVTVNDKQPYEYNHGGVWSPDLFSGQYAIYQRGIDYYTDPLSPLFITTSDYPFYQEEFARTYSMRFDLTSNRWEGHLIKTGAMVVYNDLQRYALANPANERLNRFTGEWSQGSNRNIFHTYNPEANWYIQDRWEYEGMVVNFGLRWDMFSPGSAANIELTNEDVNRNVVKYKTQFSPRLGFAFPITDRDGFHFHYGRFIQFPSRENLFASQDPVGNNGTLGNPNLQPMTTVQYQAGVRHQFTDFLAGQFAIYSKDMYDLIASTQVTDAETGNTLQRYINKAYASARGVEFSLNKRFSSNFSFDITYTLSFADGVASDTDFGGNPEGLEYLPSQELPLDWDQRHVFNFLLNIANPGVWSTGFTFSYGSGFPWTPIVVIVVSWFRKAPTAGILVASRSYQLGADGLVDGVLDLIQGPQFPFELTGGDQLLAQQHAANPQSGRE